MNSSRLAVPALLAGLSVLASAQAVSTKKEGHLLGRLGRMVKGSPIYAKPENGAQVLAKATPGRYVVVRPARPEGWVAIVLDSRRLAYVPTKAVEALDFDVTDGGSSMKAQTGPKRRVGLAAAAFALGARGLKAVDRGKALQDGVGNGEFVALAFAQQGLVLPVSPAAQAKMGAPVERYEDLRPGDRLYLWDDRTNRIGQAAIYVGGGFIVMADPKKGEVASIYLDAALRKRAVAARRS